MTLIEIYNWISLRPGMTLIEIYNWISRTRHATKRNIELGLCMARYDTNRKLELGLWCQMWHWWDTKLTAESELQVDKAVSVCVVCVPSVSVALWMSLVQSVSWGHWTLTRGHWTLTQSLTPGHCGPLALSYCQFYDVLVTQCRWPCLWDTWRRQTRPAASSVGTCGSVCDLVLLSPL